MTLPAAWAVQIALHDALTADAVLNEIGVSVLDDVPEDAGFPFLTIGEAHAEDYPGVPGAREHELRIRAYSRWGGRSELKRVEGAVTAALDGAALPLDGHRLASCRFVSADVTARPDHDTFEAVMRFRLVTEPMGETS